MNAPRGSRRWNASRRRRRRPPDEAPPSAQQKPRAASSVPDAEILSILAAAERGTSSASFAYPPPPGSSARGDRDSHPASKAGRLAMDAKTHRMRPSTPDHPRAGDASRAVRDAVEVLAGAIRTRGGGC